MQEYSPLIFIIFGVWIWFKLPETLKIITAVIAGIGAVVWIGNRLHWGGWLKDVGAVVLAGLIFLAIEFLISGAAAIVAGGFKRGFYAAVISVSSIGLLLTLFSVVPALKPFYGRITGLIPGTITAPLAAIGEGFSLKGEEIAVIKLVVISVFRVIAIIWSIKELIDMIGGKIRIWIALIIAFIIQFRFYSTISYYENSFFGPVVWIIFIVALYLVSFFLKDAVVAPIQSKLFGWIPVSTSSKPEKEPGMMDIFLSDTGNEDQDVGWFYDENNDPVSIRRNSNNGDAYTYDEKGNYIPLNNSDGWYRDPKTGERYRPRD